MRTERYYKDGNGDLQVEVLGEDDRPVAVAKRERKAVIWARALQTVSDSLVEDGYDRTSADALATFLLFQELPLAERTRLKDMAATVATRAKARIQLVRDAADNDEVDGILP